jgi:hypothetical protein
MHPPCDPTVHIRWLSSGVEAKAAERIGERTSTAFAPKTSDV